MEKICVTVSMEEERLKALEFVLKKKNSSVSVQRRMDDALRLLYEKEVPEPIREYVDSLLAPPPRPRRPVRAAKAANGQAAAMQQEE